MPRPKWQQFKCLVRQVPASVVPPPRSSEEPLPQRCPWPCSFVAARHSAGGFRGRLTASARAGESVKHSDSIVRDSEASVPVIRRRDGELQGTRPGAHDVAPRVPWRKCVALPVDLLTGKRPLFVPHGADSVIPTYRFESLRLPRGICHRLMPSSTSEIAERVASFRWRPVVRRSSSWRWGSDAPEG